MANATQIVAAARGWLGTAFKHQGRRKRCGVDKGGVDCLGLLVGVAAECGLKRQGMWLAQCDQRDYGHFPPQERLKEALGTYLTQAPVAAIQAGDVLLLQVDGLAQHLAIVGNYEADGGQLSLIHAYAPARAVVEHRLDDGWRKAIAGVFWFDCHETDMRGCYSQRL